jgi:hypothetical protein
MCDRAGNVDNGTVVKAWAGAGEPDVRCAEAA